MFFGKKIKKQIRDLALQNPNEEICGLIVFNNDKLEVFQCKNDSSKKNETFSLNTKDYLKYSLLGEIVGVFHSHPEGTINAGEYDKIQLNGHNIKYLIYSLEEDAFGEHEPQNYKSPYIGREFIWGKQDCLSLIIDYYNNELNLKMENLFPNRNSKIWITLPGGFAYNIHKENYDKYGFKLITERFNENIKLEKNDLLLIKQENDTIPKHAGIYIGGGKILHQPRNHYSLIEDLNINIKNRICEVLRVC